MSQPGKLILYTAITLTLISIVAWQATGGDWYTKFEVVEQVESPLNPNDPLVVAGFYDNDTVTKTITREEFRFGLLPTPSGLLDKHAVSVISIAAPPWALALAILWYQKRRSNRQKLRKDG